MNRPIAPKAPDAPRPVVTTGSVDVPALVEPSVTAIPHPARLIDLFPNRIVADSNVFEFSVQSARTSNAAPVADLALKPTSVLTVKAVEDRCRVIAHLSEAARLITINGEFSWRSNRAVREASLTRISNGSVASRCGSR
jgi:hypothetical protein